MPFQSDCVLEIAVTVFCKFGSKHGRVVTALASHKCGQVQIPALTPYVGMEFVVVSLPHSERFFSGYSSFPLYSKINFPNSNSSRNQVVEEPLSG